MVSSVEIEVGKLGVLNKICYSYDSGLLDDCNRGEVRFCSVLGSLVIIFVSVDWVVLVVVVMVVVCVF